METVKVVPEPVKGKERAKSGVRFPYFDLNDSIAIARTLHDKAGGAAELPQLASLLGHKGINSGTFRLRVSAAKMYGLIEKTGNRLRVSQRGTAIVAPVSDQLASQARVAAFLSVDLFKKVFDRFNGTTLPQVAGLRNLLETEYQVVSDRVAPTVRVLLDSAEQAGFFRTSGNRSQMVRPLDAAPANGQSAASVERTPAQGSAGTGSTGAGGGGNGSRGGGGGDGGGGGEIEAQVLGLLRRLPPVGTPLSSKRRQKLIDAFKSNLDWFYPDTEDEDEENTSGQRPVP